MIHPLVALGDYSYEVVPQRIGRLKKHLGRTFGDIANLSFESVDGFVDELGDRAHRVLQVFIPDLMPLYEWLGYRSQDALDNDEEPEDDKGPTFPQIVSAFEVVMQANRFDLFSHLKAVVSPDLLRAQIAGALARTMDGQTMTSQSTSSIPGLDTPLTTSGTSSPTSDESAASPSPA